MVQPSGAPGGVISAVKANRVRRLAPMPPLVARMAGAFAGIALTVGVQRRRGKHNYVGCPVDVRRVQIAQARSFHDLNMCIKASFRTHDVHMYRKVSTGTTAQDRLSLTDKP